MRGLPFIALVLLLVSCSSFAEAPTLTPTRALSGATLAPTEPVIPMPPTEVPASFYDTYGSSDPTAAALPNGLDLPPLAVTGADGTSTVQITLADSVLTGQWYANVPVRAPGVLLLAEDRTMWGDLPRTLEANGYPVLAVDYPATLFAADFTTVLGSILDLGQGDSSRLDPGRLAVVAYGDVSVGALSGCTTDLRCDALALFNPQLGDGSVVAVGNFGARPLWLGADSTSPEVFASTQRLSGAGSGNITFFAAQTNITAEGSASLVSWLAGALR